MTEENARRAEENAVGRQHITSENNLSLTHYNNQLYMWEQAKKKAFQEFEAERANAIRSLSALRINVSPRFQDIIDNFLSQIPE